MLYRGFDGVGGILQMSRVLALAGSVVLGLLSTSTFAADVIDPPAAYDWSGFYVGVSGGWAWANNDADYDCVDYGINCFTNGGPFPTEADLDTDGAIIGGTIGANWQHDIWVFGLEADMSWTDLDADDESNAFPGFPIRAELSMDWLATVRARLGFASDNLLLYVTGGLAIADTELSTDQIPPDFQGSKDDTQLGWTAGGGAEFAISEELTVKGEVLYYDLGSVSATATDPVNFPGFSYDLDNDLTGVIARAGINLRL
jgi:outer membrane immunogenic protein